MPIKIKVCGITSLDDALAAIAAGADALGFIFYEKSPRFINKEKAKAIIAQLPAYVITVGLFVNAESQLVKDTMQAVPLCLLQFHGDESTEYCESFAYPYVKVTRVSSEQDVKIAINSYKTARAVHLDAYNKHIYGGSGESFSWDFLPANSKRPLIVSGGLNIDNLQCLLAKAKPYAVDVCSGVESSPGVKDINKLQEFCKVIRHYESTSSNCT